MACLEFLSQPNSGASDSSTATENVSDAGLYSMQHQSCNENNKVPTEIACRYCVERDRSSVPLAVGLGNVLTQLCTKGWFYPQSPTANKSLVYFRPLI